MPSGFSGFLGANGGTTASGSTTMGTTAAGSGTMTVVQIRLSNSSYTQIISGLSAGDLVEVVTTTSTNNNTFGGMGNFGGGGQFPTGGGTIKRSTTGG